MILVLTPSDAGYFRLAFFILFWGLIFASVFELLLRKPLSLNAFFTAMFASISTFILVFYTPAQGLNFSNTIPHQGTKMSKLILTDSQTLSTEEVKDKNQKEWRQGNRILPSEIEQEAMGSPFFNLIKHVRHQSDGSGTPFLLYFKQARVSDALPSTRIEPDIRLTIYALTGIPLLKGIDPEIKENQRIGHRYGWLAYNSSSFIEGGLSDVAVCQYANERSFLKVLMIEDVNPVSTRWLDCFEANRM